MFTKSKLPTLYVDKDTPSIQPLQERYNVILSPSLYWVKKLTLPMRYAREVKKLLPSIFEDLLPEGNYSYYVYKHEDAYIAFAYDDREIFSLLENKGLSSNSVAKIFFAQNVLEGITHPIAISQEEALFEKEGIWLSLPRNWVENPQEIDIETLELKHPLTLSTFAHIIDPKIFVRMSAIVLLFTVLFVGESFFIKHQTEAIIEEKNKLFESYDLKATSMQNNAMLKKYTSMHEKQTKIRSVTAQILSLKLPPQSFLKHLELKGENLVAEFATNDAKKLLDSIKKLDFKHTADTKTDSLRIEVVL